MWLAIAQGLARHIEGDAEALRSRLVRHAGKVAIETRRDELDLEPSSELHWAAAVEGLTAYFFPPSSWRIAFSSGSLEKSK